MPNDFNTHAQERNREILRPRPTFFEFNGNRQASAASHALLAATYFFSIVMTVVTLLRDPQGGAVMLLLLTSQTLLLSLSFSFPSKRLVSIFELLYYVYFTFNIIRGSVLFPHSFLTEHAYLGYVPYEDYLYGAAVFLVGTIGFTAGALFLVGKVRDSSVGWRALEPEARILVSCSLIAIYIILVSIVLQDGGSVSQKRIFTDESGISTRFGPVRLMLNCLYFYVTCYGYAAFVRGRIDYWAVGCLISGIAVSIVISLRVFALISVLPFIFVFIRKVSARGIVLAAVMVPAMIFAIAYTSAKRSDSTAERSLGMTEAGTIFVRSVTLSANFGGFVASAISTAPLRESLPPLLGSTLTIDPVMQFVPRAFYPDKPEELGGRLRPLQQDVGILPQKIQGGLPPGLFAEFWLNFRWAGVIFLSFLLGALTRYIHEVIENAGSYQRAGLFLFAGVLLVFFGFGGHTARLVFFTSQLIATLLVLSALQGFIRPHSPPNSRNFA